MTDNLSPADLAAFDQSWQTVSRTLDNLVSAYRNVTSDGGAPQEVDLILFASALPETVETRSMGALLACAAARLAGDVERDRPDPVEALRAAYWKLRGHAAGYRSTHVFRRRQEFFRSDPDNPVAARGAARDEWYARGIEAAADDFAEILALEYDAAIDPLDEPQPNPRPAPGVEQQHRAAIAAEIRAALTADQADDDTTSGEAIWGQAGYRRGLAAAADIAAEGTGIS